MFAIALPCITTLALMTVTLSWVGAAFPASLCTTLLTMSESRLWGNPHCWTCRSLVCWPTYAPSVPVVCSRLRYKQPQSDAVLCGCRAGKTQWVHDYLASSLPALPQCGKKAVADLVDSRPDFHPLSGWTHVQQLHGHKVTVVSSFVFITLYVVAKVSGIPCHLSVPYIP